MSKVPYSSKSSNTLSITYPPGSGLDLSMPNNHHPFEGMDIRITRASNGMIVSIKDDNRSKRELHVIHDNEDLGQELGKIITMLVLKKE